MVTIKQIAKEAGVSRGTVDRVINHRFGVNSETEKKVKEVIQRLGYQPNVSGKMLAGQKKNIVFGFVVYDSPDTLFHKEIYIAAKRKARELENLGVKTVFFKAKELTDEYLVSFFEKVEQASLDGLIISPLHLQTVTEFLDSISSKNIPTVFYNVDNSNYNKLCYVGCDYKKSGKVAAGLVALSINQKGKVAVATVLDKNSPSSYERLVGFESEIARNFPEIEIINKKESLLFKNNDYQDVLAFLEANPGVKAIYIVNPGDCGIYEKIFGIYGSDIKIITNDLLTKQRKLMKSGVITATIDQQPDVQGELPLQILYDYLLLGKQVEREAYYTQLQIYIPQNL